MPPSATEAGSNNSSVPKQHTPASLGLTAAKEKSLKEVVQAVKLVADETRAHILFYLCNTPELHVRAICELVGQSQPAVSHHLALLRVAGVIESRRDGKHNFYRIVPRRVRQLLGHFFEKLVENETLKIDGVELSFKAAG